MPAPTQNFDDIRLLVKLGIARSSDGQLYPAPLNIVALTASRTLLTSDPCGTVFTNRGAAGAVTLTLPPPVGMFPVGYFFEVYGIAAQNLIVATATTDTLAGINDVAADSITISTAGQIIGAHAKVFFDGTQWCFNGDTVGITYTLAT